jgi:hypothetical protein
MEAFIPDRAFPVERSLAFQITFRRHNLLSILIVLILHDKRLTQTTVIMKGTAKCNTRAAVTELCTEMIYNISQPTLHHRFPIIRRGMTDMSLIDTKQNKQQSLWMKTH